MGKSKTSLHDSLAKGNRRERGEREREGMVSEALVFPLRKRASVTRDGCKRRDEGDAEEEETGAMMMAMKRTKKRSSTSRRRAKGRAVLASVMKAIVVLACVVL